MCAIVDANVASEVFGQSPRPAGEKFFEWIESGSARLVVGGRLLEELQKASIEFTRWARTAVRLGKMTLVDHDLVDATAEDLSATGQCRSNDTHVIALAQISGARLLYSNDTILHQDFKNRRLIDRPRGIIYSTNRTTEFTPSRQKLLRRTDLCQSNP